MRPEQRYAILGEVAYVAYGDSVGWVNFLGDRMPPWDELHDTQRYGWASSAQAVERKLVTPESGG